MLTIKNFLTNSHTWVTLASVVAGAVTAYENVNTVTGAVAGVLTVVLFICTLVINDNQVMAASAK